MRVATLACSILLISLASAMQLAAQQREKLSCSHVNHSLKNHGNRMARTQSDMDNYDVKFYFLDIEADNQSSYIKANVSMKVQAVSGDLDEIAIGLSNLMQVDSLYFGDVKITYLHAEDIVTFAPPSPLNQGDIFTTTIFYHGDGTGSSFFSGISSSTAITGDKYTWTLSEPENAIDWFACKQSLEDKADSAYIFITVPENLKAASNGLLTNIIPVNGDRKRFEWKTKYPIDYYLISMSIGEYAEYNTTAMVGGAEMLIQNYLYDQPGILEAYKPLLDETGAMVEDLSDLFGPYPFVEEKYGHVMAPLGGGMEHQTMSTMDGFSFTLIAHELGHQWFGDNVTCSTWQDIWVNEGFASYTEYLMLEKLRSKNEADNWMAGAYENVLSQSSGSVYVPLNLAKDEFRIFDFRLTYCKGAALIHMIRNIVDDDEVFFNVLKSFQQAYAGGVASGDDFKNILEQESGMNFDDFFNEWYYGEGHPLYKIRWNFDSDTLYLKQIQTSSSVTPFFHIPIDYKIEFADSDTTIRVNATASEQTFRIYTGRPIKKLTIDPEHWVLKNVTSVVRDYGLKGPPVVTSIEHDLSADFAIYPNPATAVITISAKDSAPYKVRFINSMGVVLSETVSLAGEAQIKTGEFDSGIFFVRIISDRGIVTRKVSVLK